MIDNERLIIRAPANGVFLLPRVRSTLLLGDGEFLVAQHELAAIGQSFQCQVDERPGAYGLIGTTAVVEEKGGMVGDMLGQEGNQST